MDARQTETQTDPVAEAITDLEILVTAEEAFPAFERLCLSAQRRIVGSFRIFDLATKLRTPEAREIGETWFDLIVHLLDRGVAIDITVTDFDPIARTDLHRLSWLSARHLAAANEMSRGGKLKFWIHMHPARVGVLPNLVFAWKARSELQGKQPDALTPKLPDEPDGQIELVPGTHHQKLAVVDGEALYIGGLDLNDRRYDTLAHDREADQTWADMQAIARGPVVMAAFRHLDTFRDAAAGEIDPPPQAPGFLRTLSCRRDMKLLHIAPRPLATELEQAHYDAISATEGPIYLETQFFRHRPLAEALAQAAAAKPDLTCTLILPASPEDVAFDGNRGEDAQFAAQKQLDAVEIVTEAFGSRIAIASPAQKREVPEDSRDATVLHRAPIIYVHTKLSLFGTEEGILSSANLNGRSLRWDTEAGLHLRRPEHVRMAWDRVRNHWLHDQGPEPLADPLGFINWLNESIEENAAMAPAERPHFLLPFPRERDRKLAKPLPGVPDEIV